MLYIWEKHTSDGGGASGNWLPISRLRKTEDKLRKQLLFYRFMLISFGLALAAILHFGAGLHPSRGIIVSPEGSSNEPIENLYSVLQQPLPLLLIQIIVIVLTARTIGFLFQKINQPAVVGEMVAGILLGPSWRGVLSPQIEAFLFPVRAMGNLPSKA